MESEKININHVSDTALWVAHYRATESQRSDALFNDKLASVLVGERGRKIAAHMQSTSRYTAWSVAIRTTIIDRYITQLVADGVDTVINLGAGLDTRPYRMSLPQALNWFEVDYPHVIEYKEKLLTGEKPTVQLQRIALDLADRNKRVQLFNKLGLTAKKALVLTEGVIVYLTEEQVTDLAEDIYSQKNFYYWITEFISPKIYHYYNSKQRQKKMAKSPFQFFPPDWWGFFKKLNWAPKEIKYSALESEKLGRKQPLPIWAAVFISLFGRFMNKEKLAEKYQKRMGYTLLVKV